MSSSSLVHYSQVYVIKTQAMHVYNDSTCSGPGHALSHNS